MALTKQGQIYSWGDNKNGELGSGDYKELSQPKLLKDLEDKKVV